MTDFIRRHPIASSVAAAVLLAAALAGVISLVRPAGEAEHAAGHLAIGIPLILVAVAAVTLWAPPTAGLGRVGRIVLVAGLSVFALGQILESVGAFGYDGYARTNPSLALLHDIGLVGMIGMPVLTIGVILSLLAGVGRPSWTRGTTYSVVAASGLALAALTSQMFGAPLIAGALVGAALLVGLLGLASVRRRHPA
ncbi:MAG: hypothetical protein ACR2LG_05325 [Actinomycetota bacterium]|nr:hypothetical protein [Actinomycetota bacterium]